MSLIIPPMSNDPRIQRGHMMKVPYGDITLTNVGLSEAFAVSREHDVAITAIYHGDHYLSNEEVISGLIPRNHLFYYDKVQDSASLFRSKDVQFYRMMQELYNAVPVIARGDHGKHVMVNCLAGISRSSALTLWIMAHVAPGKSAEELLHDLVNDVNMIADPNPAFIEWIETYDSRIGNFQGMKKLCESRKAFY